MRNLMTPPVTPTGCSDPAAAKLFWDHWAEFGHLACRDRAEAFRHVALCRSCNARLEALAQAEQPAAEATPTLTRSPGG